MRRNRVDTNTIQAPDGELPKSYWPHPWRIDPDPSEETTSFFLTPTSIPSSKSGRLQDEPAIFLYVEVLKDFSLRRNSQRGMNHFATFHLNWLTHTKLNYKTHTHQHNVFFDNLIFLFCLLDTWYVITWSLILIVFALYEYRVPKWLM